MIKVKNNKGTNKTYQYDYKHLYVNSETHSKVTELSIDTGLSMKELVERIVDTAYTQYHCPGCISVKMIEDGLLDED